MPSKPQFVGEKVRVSDVFDLRMGKTPSRKNLSYWHDGNHDWISIADLGSFGKYVGSTKERINDLAIAETGIKPAPANTVLMSFKLSLGKTAITTIPVYTNEAIMAFVDKGVYPVDPSFMYHQCRAKDWTADTNTAVMGKTLNKKTLGQQMVFLPGLAEQKAIARQLDFVERQLVNANEQLEQLDSLVKSRFVEMFGDPCDPGSSSAKSRIDSFCELRIGPFGSALHKEDYITGGHPLVNPSHIIGGAIRPDENLTIDDDKYESLAAYHLLPGDVVLGRRGEIGRCAVVKTDGLICGTGSMIIRPGQKVRSDYLQRVVSFPSFSHALEANAVGVTMKNLNAKIVGSAEVYLPDLEDHDAFISFVSQVDKSRFVDLGDQGGT
ncbi:restriction endonuclease subunit S, partial [Ellagibacter isourolithinifaciens]|uniref:restriction endonuclease subunit S n=1 Tax=Ellagibacter isourolithinifaciens TaxID=2137581 RepID=UPI003AF05379